MADPNQGLAQSKAAAEFLADVAELTNDPVLTKLAALIAEYFQVNPRAGTPPTGPP